MPASAAAARSCVVAVVEGAVAERRADAPAVDLLAELVRRFLDRLEAVLDAEPDADVDPRAERLEVEGLARRDPDLGEPRAQRRLLAAPAARTAAGSSGTRMKSVLNALSVNAGNFGAGGAGGGGCFRNADSGWTR